MPVNRTLFLAFAAILALIFFGLAALSHVSDGGERDVVYQTSTISALMLGAYDGSLSFADLARHGDFGLGTLDALDGEMIALDGTFYQARADGSVAVVAPDMTTPFAVVTPFDRDGSIALAGPLNLTGLERRIENAFPSQNLFYAVRVDGTFTRIEVRSVPAQQVPYPPLVVAVENQTIFEYEQIDGTLVGFWSPAYVSGINVPGWHLHFISDDRSRGGHVLGLELADGEGWIDASATFTLDVPSEGSFSTLDLTGDASADLDTVEKGG
jgi:acetolactate decarboxylase